MSVSGRGAKQKGSRFEREVRNELRRIYASERRSNIQRVPLSGASHFKGDVIDMNDTDWSYECKKQERLSLPLWWRQTKRQAKPYQIPCLVFSSNHRPMYWIIESRHWKTFMEQLHREYYFINGKTRNMYKYLSLLGDQEVLLIKLDGDMVVVIPNELFIGIRKELYNNENKLEDLQ